MAARIAEKPHCAVEPTTPRTPRTPPLAQPIAPRGGGAGLERACTAPRRRYLGSREVAHGRRPLAALRRTAVRHDDAAEGGAP